MRSLLLVVLASCSFPELVADDPSQTPTSWSAVTLGFTHACAITEQHELYCWGLNSNGRLGLPDVAATATPTRVSDVAVRAISSGSSHTCALDIDDGLWCWGSNLRGQLGDGTTQNKPSPTRIGDARWSHITTGYQHTCGIQVDGSLWCWGDNAYRQVSEDATETYLAPQRVATATEAWIDVSSRGYFSCAIRSSGTARCWGGHDFTLDASGELPVAGWTHISVGASLACGLRSNNEIWCLGTGHSGELIEPDHAPVPRPLGNGDGWQRVSVGEAHVCAIDAEDMTWCWGSNKLGQLGNTAAGDFIPPTAITTARAIATSNSTCLVTLDGELRCAGSNALGILGANTGLHPTPTQVGTSRDWTSVATNPEALHVCGVQAPASASCWGYNESGQLGTGNLLPGQQPAAVATTIDQLRVLGDGTCGSDVTGRFRCWGANGGAFGDASFENALTPTEGPRSSATTTWSAGRQHICAIDEVGRMSCWGSNATGELGIGTTDDQSVPVSVGTGMDWLYVSAGTRSTCAIRSDRTLWCWGRNTGDGTDTVRLSPVQVGTGYAWRRVAHGSSHACALTVGGELFCWGQNDAGQLGDGTNVVRMTPTRIGTRMDWSSLTLGARFSCALDASSALWCTGNNVAGQLGDETYTSRSVFAPSAFGAPWKEVHAGSRFMCGIRMDGSLWCWGENSLGQLGTGTSWRNSFEPVVL